MIVSRMTSLKISFNVAREYNASVCALLAGAKGLSAATWSTHAVTTDSTLKPLIQALVVLLDGFDPTLPDKRFCTVEQMTMVAREMGKCNKAISAGSTAMVAFLTDLGVSAKGGKLFFPHEENKTRPQDRLERGKAYAAAVVLVEPDDPSSIKLEEAFALKKHSAVPAPAAGGGGAEAAGGGGAAVVKIPVDIFRSSEEVRVMVEMHPGSRRKGCHVPAGSLWPALRASMCSPNVVAKQEIGYDKRPVVMIHVPCPGCETHNQLARAAGLEVKKPELVKLPFGPLCNFVQKVFKEEEAAAEKACPLPAMIPLMEDKSKLPIAVLYDVVRASAAKRNPELSSFRCPNEECLCAEKPRIFKPHAGCMDCITRFNEGEVTYFHLMRCQSCDTEACGLCNKPRDKHEGEREMCPRKKKITAEERAAARLENNYFCPLCEVPVHWIDGCPHLTCPNLDCNHHWCANCDGHLRVSANGTRYTHECPNPGRANAYFHTQAQAAAHGLIGPLGRAEKNPTVHHMIFIGGVLNGKGMRAFGRKQLEAARARRAAAAGGGGGGGGGAAAAGGGGGAAAAGGGGGAAAAGGGGGAAAAGGGGGAAAAGGGGGGGAAMAAAAGGGGAAAAGGGGAAAAGGGGAAAAGGGADEEVDDAALAQQMQLAEWGGAP
jgi:hypothetical protein